MLSRIGLRSLALGIAAIAAFVPPALAAPAVSGEFDVPNLASNSKLIEGPDGNIWVALNGTKDVARITPAGVVEEFDLEAITPSGITVGPNGLIWITRNGGVISFDPANPEASKKLTDVALIGTNSSIALGPDGNLWVASTGKLVRVPPGNPLAATEFKITGLEPKDIDAAGSLLVVASFEKVVAVTTAGNVVGEHKVGGQSQGVAGNPNGQYAYTQPVATPKEIGLLSPTAAPIVRSAEGTDPFGIALGSDGAYWAPEFISDGLTRITADGTVSGLTGFQKNSAPRQIAAGPGNTLWVTLEMTNKVGRVSGLEPPPLPPPPPPPPVVLPPKAAGTIEPRTVLTKGPSGKVTTKKKKRRVTFSFESPDAGATFECRVEVVVKKKKAKASVVTEFKPCASPKSFTLKVGHYRFEVRALLAGVPDQTPERRGFRIVRAAAKK